MSKPACPSCEMTEVLDHPEQWECVTCGHQWPRDPQPDAAQARVVKDAHGTPLADGDTVALIKDLKLKGSSQVIKGGRRRRASGWWTGTTKSPARSTGPPSA